MKHDHCPNCGIDLRYWDEQQIRADQVLSEVTGPLQIYWRQHFGLGVGNVQGKFLGLVCSSCSHWQEAGHADNCPVKELEKQYVKRGHE